MSKPNHSNNSWKLIVKNTVNSIDLTLAKIQQLANNAGVTIQHHQIELDQGKELSHLVLGLDNPKQESKRNDEFVRLLQQESDIIEISQYQSPLRSCLTN
ncbi:hypothetical protein [Kangiella sp. TOML190]|uniref:hypothetical protein n=1 Tax=Kangiella sp. TOML190 TaxID=2931351 RepID=UPI0020422DC3|nr:hypothetical protein [Kangiella sp. TOML190]